MSSLKVDAGRRGRSRSPGGRERSRSRGPPIDTSVADTAPVPYPDDPRGSGPRIYDYGEEGTPYDPYPPPPRSPNIADAYPREDDYRSPRGDDYKSPRADDYSRRDVDVRFAEPNGRREKEYRYEKERDKDNDRDRERERERERDRARERGGPRDSDRDIADKLSFLPGKYSKSGATDSPRDPRRDRDRDRARDSDSDRKRDSDRDRDRDRERDRDADRRRAKRHDSDSDDDALAYGKGPVPPAASRYAPRPESPPSGTYKYAEPKQWEYAKTEDPRMSHSDRNPRDNLGVDPRYSSASIGRDRSPGPSIKRDRSPGPGARDDDRKPSSRHERSGSTNIVTVEPGQRSSTKRDRSPMPPTARMSSLSVSTPHASHRSLSAAPGSPLLESYHGTYQSMSPMPSPLMLPADGSDPSRFDLNPSDFDEPMSPTTERKQQRRARFTDISSDASVLAKALKGSGPPDTAPLIELLPGLTHEQVMELRTAYKALVKTGPERKGVNVAKHIRARLKDEDTNLMKACYATALGKWEGEAYWANFWYQGDKTRRELLIEALMGRTNAEIRQIKAGFSDKKYDNSLVRCMRQELKEDKFKKAVLMVLDEKRMEDVDERGRPLPVDKRLVEEDARALYKAVRAEKGGETAMIEIVVRRSDAHLREVLRLYSAQYRSNFAKDALRKSTNLVGELLAHILNGVINKPVRDALLVHHAVMLGKKDALRRELLISRLVRFHWDRHHMAAVKRAYRDRYDHRDLQDVVREATAGTGGWGQFCRELCVARMPDDVRRFDKVEIIDR